MWFLHVLDTSKLTSLSLKFSAFSTVHRTVCTLTSNAVGSDDLHGSECYFNPGDGAGMILWNVGIHPPHLAKQPRKPRILPLLRFSCINTQRRTLFMCVIKSAGLVPSFSSYYDQRTRFFQVFRPWSRPFESLLCGIHPSIQLPISLSIHSWMKGQGKRNRKTRL